MEITQAAISITGVSQKISSVNLILSSLAETSKRPCKDCTKACSCSKSAVCLCDCSTVCPQMRAQLSSDKVNYPIEDKISPLVYAFNMMNVAKSCWSCEGHTNIDGELTKLPQLWFYSDSTLLLRLLDDSLSLFHIKGMTTSSWGITSTYSARESLDDTFAIKPCMDLSAPADLTSLQQDIVIISLHLSDVLQKRCLEYSRFLTKKLQTLE